MELLAEKLGEEVAVDNGAFRELVPELIAGSGKLISFGAGLALGAAAPRTLWQELTEAFCQAPEKSRGTQLLKGFIRKLAEGQPALASELLTEAIEKPILSVSFPELQCSIPIDSEGVERLRQSLALDLAPIDAFRHLAWGQAHATVTSTDLRDLVERIAAKPRGTSVALEIVFFRLSGEAERAHEPETIGAGLALLTQLQFDEPNRRLDHELRLVVAACLSEAGGGALAAKLCKGLKQAVADRKARIEQYHEFFEALCKVQPRAVLDGFFAGDEQERRAAVWMMKTLVAHHRNPLDAMQEDELSGSLAVLLEGRKPLLAELEEHPDPRLAEFARADASRFAEEIEAERRWEAEHDRAMDQRFE